MKVNINKKIKKLTIAIDLTELMNGIGVNANIEPENPAPVINAKSPPFLIA
jgi:hypothetical protein|tara:strand:- start:2195 stop:2347 length:153 start_codon:yes stop_codon:yes gene_type:complete